MWKKKYEASGDFTHVDPVLKRSQLENLSLKQILADKELALKEANETFDRFQKFYDKYLKAKGFCYK